MAGIAVWRGLMLVIVLVWLAVFLSDRLHLWLCARRVRRETRREVQYYLRSCIPSGERLA